MLARSSRSVMIWNNSSAPWVDLDVAEFIEQEQVEAAVAANDSRKLTFVDGFDEFVDQLSGSCVADSAALLTGGQAERDEQMGLAGAGIAKQDHGLAGVDVGAGGQGGQLRGGDGRDGVEVELGKAFDARELRFADSPGASSFGTFVDLGCEYFGEKRQV
ncbi:hypothetical protein [Actinopolymorpha sp. B9G3]|uniref:hypothetical protein n=1 Tax=Actinopolymorpha sp. B9G3 TaxID=3158970 RepID=UPI0032D8F178